jgi:hypothetical protein
MTLTEPEMKEIMDRVLEHFDKDEVKVMDDLYTEFDGMREVAC